MGEGHRGHWVAREGLIDYDGKATAKKHVDRGLWSKKSYQETELYVEWRFPDKPVIKQHPIVLWNGNFLRDEKGKRITRPHLDAGDSGILFRGILDCQANIWCQEMGSGETNGYRTDKSLNHFFFPWVTLTEEVLQSALRKVGIKHPKAWCSENLPQSVQSKRHRDLGPIIKEQKQDNIKTTPTLHFNSPRWAFIRGSAIIWGSGSVLRTCSLPLRQQPC